MKQDKGYTLGTGKSGAYRLQILDAIHKPYTEFVMRQAGLSEGMRIADIGCGTGNVSFWLQEQVKFSGSVLGVDMSVAQLEIARSQAKALGLSNVTFTEGSLYLAPLRIHTAELKICTIWLQYLRSLIT